VESSVIEIPLDASEPADAISNPDPDLPLRCTFQIIHTFAHNTGVSPILPGTITGRRKPALDSLIIRRLVLHISASISCELTDAASTCKLSMTLERGSPAVVNPAIILSDNDPILQAYPDLSEEPTLEDLAQFVGSLKGKKVFLYADAAGIFAQHLTSYLTSWGLDVTHASSDSDTEGSDAVNIPSVEHPPVSSEARGPSILPTLDEQDLDLPPSAPQTPKAPNQAPSFILIDDDISVFRERLQKLRVDLPHSFQFSRKRPNLAANHRPRSSPQVVRSIGHSSIPSSPRNVAVIVYFTNLANFKLVKGILQSVLGPNLGTTSRLPEVIVIPKPAGPRRVLTALHTAAVKPIVDPFFSPIATSPISPGLYPAASYFHHQNLSPKSPMSRPSSSPRAYSNQSLRSPKAAVEPTSDAFALPPSPLGLTEGIDYFAEAAEKLGSSPSSGLVIQSPSGQPAGIFFHPPRARGSRSSSHSVSVENTVYSRGSRSHSDSAERTRPAGGVTFLNLPTSFQQRSNSIPQVAPGPTGSGTATLMAAIPGGEVPAAAGHTGTSPGARQVAKRTGAIEVLRKTVSPPSSPRTSPTGAKHSARWGSGSRRSQATSPSPMRKSKPTEPSIVPPISVLIVEGVYLL
jgi:osomolarity two-component system response regulator SSK1